MPWLVSSQLYPLSSSPSQRQCERTAFAFYCAVRDLEPVWVLEDMRRMEVFCWDGGCPRAFEPSDALLYSLVHDHRDYARYLLNRFSVSALRAPCCSFCCGSSGAPHLTVAVRYNRLDILTLMTETLKDLPEAERRDYLDRCSSCCHVSDGGKTAVQLAADLVRPDCLLLLLVHGARPDGLEVALRRLEVAEVAEHRDAQRCLDFLLLFLPKLPMAPLCLKNEPQHWQNLLGNEVFDWLSGSAPPSLLLQALRTLARSVPGQIADLPDRLHPHSCP